jgi:hypothetical protein
MFDRRMIPPEDPSLLMAKETALMQKALAYSKLIPGL